jgi:2',3'-cyclic-nucleotide 2'-phosphodiesterase (5'-nucleotidase family)
MWWWSALAVAAPALTDERATGPLAARFGPADGAALSLLVVGEHDGRVGPCGCSVVPRGGLAKLATAVAARRDADPTPTLLLHGGAWLSAGSTVGDDGGALLSREALTADAVMHTALGRLPFDALNTTPRDLPAVALGPHPGMVAANAAGHGQPVTAAKTFDRGGVEVRVIGVSAPALPELQPPGTTWSDPVAALRAQPLPDEALVVVLAWGLGSRIPELADVPGVDVVVDTHAWEGVWAPVADGDVVVVRTPATAASLLELRLWVADGRVTAARQRTVPLDDEVPEDPFLAPLAPGRRAD